MSSLRTDRAVAPQSHVVATSASLSSGIGTEHAHTNPKARFLEELQDPTKPVGNGLTGEERAAIVALATRTDFAIFRSVELLDGRVQKVEAESLATDPAEGTSRITIWTKDRVRDHMTATQMGASRPMHRLSPQAVICQGAIGNEPGGIGLSRSPAQQS
jgi:hypothetical protein